MPKDGATGNQPTNLPTNTPNPSGGMSENGINAPSTPESPTECRWEIEYLGKFLSIKINIVES